MITIELEGPPQGKERPRFARKTGAVYTPGKTRAYENALRAAALDAMRGLAILTGPLEVQVFAYMPIPESWPQRKKDAAVAGRIRPTGKPDFDNIGKGALDALNPFRDHKTGIKVPVVWADDALVVDAHIHKLYSSKPRLTVAVRQLAEDTA